MNFLLAYKVSRMLPGSPFRKENDDMQDTQLKQNIAWLIFMTPASAVR
jgi:hypothetical protein